MDKPLQLLMVEDSPDDAELLLYHLKASGYAVTYERVETPAAMRAALARQTWDAIVADYTLPWFSGLAALAELHASGQDLPFIIVSGTSDEATAVAVMKAGAHDFLMKDKLVRLAPAIEREVREAQGRHERRRAEEARRESDTRYRDLFENAPISLWEQDFSAVKRRLEALRSQGVTDFHAFFGAHPEVITECLALVKSIDVNNASLRLYHASSKAQLLADLGQVLAPESLSLFKEEMCLIARGHTEFEVEGVNRTLTGERLDIDLHWSAAPGYEATLAKVLISVEDVTARKRAEAAARQAAAELQAVFEAIPDQFFHLDAQGDIQDYYAGRLAQPSLPRETLLGKNITAIMPGAFAPALQAAILQTQRTGEVVTLEYTWPAPQNALMFEVRFIPFLDQQVIAMVRNVTEREQMLAQVFNSQKLVDLGTLAAGVAHELNSPLQVITGLSESLLTRVKQNECDPSRLNQNLETINRSGWRCAEIVRSLLTYARASTGQIQPYELNTLVRDTLLLIEHQLRSWSNITVQTNLAPDLPPLQCDRNQITQILINLLTNARDAMPEGGEISIRTAHDLLTAQLVLEVSDIGTGIPEAARKKIFDPFFTTKPPGQGTGLGLYIVAGIVRAYGGEIVVHSTLGEGTTFTLTFPEKVPPADSPPEVQTGPG
jgi:signal transduction histidine kinase/DNA-binding response OmpR family regulator